jgi:adenylate kinase family enzyme
MTQANCVFNEKIPPSRGTSQGVAPLKNIERLSILTKMVVDRDPHLPGIVTFSGPSGFGKSTAAAYVAAQHQAYYVEFRSAWTRKAFLEGLLQTMGIGSKGPSTVYAMVEQAAYELSSSMRPLILDEFDHAVNQNLVELVRDVYELSKSPLILIGEEQLPQKLQKWERFHGRIMEWEQAQPASLEDAQKLNRHYAPDLTVQNDLLGILVEQSRGSVRRIVTNLERIATFARGRGLTKIGQAEWGGRELHMATPPQIRKKF